MSKLTKEQLAETLNGNRYGFEMTKEQEQQAKENGLVVVTGYSDDNCEFRGAIYDEVGCYDGGNIAVFKHENNFEVWDADSIDDMEDAKKEVSAIDAVGRSQTIKAVWCDDDLNCSWSYKTKIPHSTFQIMEDGDLYCIGIIFDLSDVS
jgi:hypothetical protein